MLNYALRPWPFGLDSRPAFTYVHAVLSAFSSSIVRSMSDDGHRTVSMVLAEVVAAQAGQELRVQSTAESYADGMNCMSCCTIRSSPTCDDTKSAAVAGR